MFETAEIEIGGTNCAEIVIDNDCLAVKHTFLIKIDLDSCPQAFLHIRKRRPAEHIAV